MYGIRLTCGRCNKQERYTGIDVKATLRAAEKKGWGLYSYRRDYVTLENLLMCGPCHKPVRARAESYKIAGEDRDR